MVSLFDGISCGRVSIERTGYAVSSYTAFEIDKYAKSISRFNYPDIRHIGDVLDADFNLYKGSNLLIGGSPCTFWSIAKTNREVNKDGIGWKLFMRYVEALRQIEPKYFLYENVKSMPVSIRDYISEELGCEPVGIDSALVSAQQRKRLYWTNIPNIVQPTDKRILLQDILEKGLSFLNKSYCVTATYGGATFEQTLRDKKRTTVAEPISEIIGIGAALRTRKDKNGSFKRLEVRNDGKMNALTTVQTDTVICTPVRLGHYGKGGQGERIYSVRGKSVCLSSNGGGLGSNTGLYKIDLPDGDYHIRKLSPIEAERCQTLPDNFTSMGVDDNGRTVPISTTQRYRAIGNGFTCDVITHILSHMKF